MLSQGEAQAVLQLHFLLREHTETLRATLTRPRSYRTLLYTVFTRIKIWEYKFYLLLGDQLSVEVATSGLTLFGFASSRIWVTAAGGRMGLKAGSSVPDGGWSFTAMLCGSAQTHTDGTFSFPARAHARWRHWTLTFGAVTRKLMSVTGTGADDSMEMMTTSTSGRDGGWERAKWKSTRRLWPSNTVTGKRLPAGTEEGGVGLHLHLSHSARNRCSLTGLNGF